MILKVYLNGLGLLGPGLSNWPDGAAALSGEREYQGSRTELPIPSILAAAERRRTGRVVKLALAIALEASNRAGEDPSRLVSVFSSSGGDGHNCHELCQALSLTAREVSPTRFAISVHNAAAGYWSIGTGAMVPSNVLCAFDASFGAGLLEALTQVAAERRTVLLVAYDTEYPEPIFSKRPIPDAFGVAMVLAPERTPASLTRLTVALTDEDFERMPDARMESLRASIPAARALPLLRRIAAGGAGRTVLEYLDVARLAVEVEPCT
jgi:hypothetical protein